MFNKVHKVRNKNHDFSLIISLDIAKIRLSQFLWRPFCKLGTLPLLRIYVTCCSMIIYETFGKGIIYVVEGGGLTLFST